MSRLIAAYDSLRKDPDAGRALMLAFEQTSPRQISVLGALYQQWVGHRLHRRDFDALDTTGPRVDTFIASIGSGTPEISIDETFIGRNHWVTSSPIHRVQYANKHEHDDPKTIEFVYLANDEILVQWMNSKPLFAELAPQISPEHMGRRNPNRAPYGVAITYDPDAARAASVVLIAQSVMTETDLRKIHRKKAQAFLADRTIRQILNRGS
jgi:hypothetical protein